MTTADLTIKFVSSKKIYTDHHATRQFPNGNTQWGNVKFTFDEDATEYDWLVVYHDVPHHLKTIPIHCPPTNTVFITHEPSAVKSYGSDFVNQFYWLFSCHESWALPHPNRIPIQPGSIWIYGADFYAEEDRGKYEYNKLASTPPLSKDKTISTVCSDKQFKHTVHYRRYTFTHQLKKELPELDIYGHGVNLIKQKANALDSYRYHLTIENDVCPDYWTEKLSDAFLGYTLPFYYGCPNVADYFPTDSYIPIDIDNFDAAFKTITKAIANNEYEKRLPAIVEARRRVLEEHNLYAMVARTIKNLPLKQNAHPSHSPSRYLHCRKQQIKNNPLLGLRYVKEKICNRRRIVRGNRLDS